jgi:hypothetical protein
MVSIEEIKQMIIKQETEWIEEIHDDKDIPIYVDGMRDDVNDCETIDDLVTFYTSTGLSINEGFEAIIKLLKENTKVKDKSQ